MWAPAVLSVTPAVEGWVKGTLRARAGAPSGPDLRVKNWVEVWSEGCVPGREGAFDRVGPALGRGRQQSAFGAEEVHVEFRERALGEVLEGDDQLAGLGIGAHRAGELDMGGEAVGDEEEAIAIPRAGFAEVDGAGDRGRAARSCRSSAVPTLENSGHWASSSVPKLRFGIGAGGLAVGGIGVDREALRQGHGERHGSPTERASWGSQVWGTLRSTSRPEAESACVVVGCA